MALLALVCAGCAASTIGVSVAPPQPPPQVGVGITLSQPVAGVHVTAGSLLDDASEETASILAGVRVAMVSTISIATVAAFLLYYGLGGPIFDALAQPDIFKTELLAASALAILLALTADTLLALLQRALTPWNRIG